MITPFVQAHYRDLTFDAKADLVQRLRNSDAIYAFPQVAYPLSVGQDGDTLGFAAD